MEFVDGAREGGMYSAMGSTPQYSRLKYTPFRLVEWRMWKRTTHAETVKRPLKLLAVSR